VSDCWDGAAHNEDLAHDEWKHGNGWNGNFQAWRVNPIVSACVEEPGVVSKQWDYGSELAAGRVPQDDTEAGCG